MPFNTKSQLNDLMAKAGIDAETAEAAMDIDWLMQKWRRRVSKRELGMRALIDLRIDLELAQLDVLTAIAGHRDETEGGPAETMVSTVAERLNIDPSRASRMVSDLVEHGYARRAVSQADARRTIIELSERGEAVIDAVRAYKFLIMGDFLAEWDKAELAAFIPLMKRFSTWMDGIGPATEKHAAEIEALAEGLVTKEPA